jgi:hypothetical protein
MVFSGYMSPEYAMDGIISIKSDVFSFGVLVLEIVSGKRNRGSYEPELDINLLGYVSITKKLNTFSAEFVVIIFRIFQAWMLWKEGRSVELLDEAIGGSFHHSKVMRCIQVALLCVETQPRNRPLMSAVVMMLASENDVLPEPNEPGVNVGMSSSDTGSSSQQTRRSATTNTVTVTALDPR